MKPLQQQGLEWPGTRRSKLQAHSVQMQMQAIAARVQHWRQRRSGRREVLETVQWWTVQALKQATRKQKLQRKAAAGSGGVQRATVQEENLQWWTVESLEEAKKQDSGGLP